MKLPGQLLPSKHDTMLCRAVRARFLHAVLTPPLHILLHPLLHAGACD